LPDACALEDEALGDGDDCVGLALGEGDDWLGDCAVGGDDWEGDCEGDCEGACAKAEPASKAAVAVVIMNLVNIAGLRVMISRIQSGKMLLMRKELPRAESTRRAVGCSSDISLNAVEFPGTSDGRSKTSG